MPKWQLKKTSHYRHYGATYQTIGHVDADTVIDAKENPDPQHFEEVPAEVPDPASKKSAAASTDKSSKEAD